MPFGADAGDHYCEIREALTRSGRLIGANDLLIAAHARAVGATLHLVVVDRAAGRS